MGRPVTAIVLTPEDRATLTQRLRAPTSEQRVVVRARIVLAAADGQSTDGIAEQLALRPATVSKWRHRFATQGVAGLADAPRPGPSRRYDAASERRILKQLDAPPPEGHATWTGAMVATALGEVSPDEVWRVLRRHGIHLRRRRSWYISTDPEFAPKAADLVGLYLAPPANAVVISVDEKPHIQALERAQGYLRLPNGTALRGFSHEYQAPRHQYVVRGTVNVATGQLTAGHYARRRRREFLDFMNDVVAGCPDQELHIVLDNLNTHKPKHDRWLARHPRVHLHYAPTRASWLNQIECWFSILSRRALQGASFTSVPQLREAIDRFVKTYNAHATPFEWRKRVVHSVGLKHCYADLRS